MGKALRCPYCGSALDFELSYTAHYSDYRELTGIECDNYQCNARWNHRGEVERISKLNTALTLVCACGESDV